MSSQGQIITKIFTEPIRLDKLFNADEQLIQNKNKIHGASVIFTGQVRNLNQGKAVVAIEYDCFIPLAEKTFYNIAVHAQKKWGQDADILILHRYGRLQLGEISVFIEVRTKHRDESYLASRFIIEQIKKQAPIWKKEFYENSETEWVQGHALCQHHTHGDC